jgi:hypothetical protein
MACGTSRVLQQGVFVSSAQQTGSVVITNLSHWSLVLSRVIHSSVCSSCAADHHTNNHLRNCTTWPIGWGIRPHKQCKVL